MVNAIRVYELGMEAVGVVTTIGGHRSLTPSVYLIRSRRLTLIPTSKNKKRSKEEMEERLISFFNFFPYILSFNL
ncbi:hypothetical protein L1987_70338 [Smallanthus sonchifolius]|uniref:Uncharacterized protein n=1 Tax=Smallanthus sonchifolius TaxID=185202 RepID=A0ACB9APK5_9ASTR|nr:hypothetical protein L1987_70338 [Smallanthus sonchifolius]